MATSLRWVSRLLGLTVVSLLMVRPALACYCLEHCILQQEQLQSGVTQSPEHRQQPNSYDVVIAWTPYGNAPTDCQYTVEGSGTGEDGSWTPQSSCIVSPETGSATCVVTASTDPESGQPSGVTWTFKVIGTSESSPSANGECTTPDEVFLPGPLPAPPEPEAERTEPARARLRWSAPSGRAVESGVSTVQQYVVRRYTDSDPTPTLLGKTADTSYLDQGLSASEGYHYEIYAADQYGIGAAALAYVPGSSSGAVGGCNSAASAAGPLALAVLAAGAFLRRPRRRS